MILISGPQQITVESGNPTDSVAVTREALPTPDESLLNNPGLFETGFRVEGLPPSHSASPAKGVSQDESKLAADSVFGEEGSSDALPLGAWLPEPMATEPPPPPRSGDIDATIQSVRAKRRESAARSRHVMLVATIGLCSVLIAIGILVVFLRWIAKPDALAKNSSAQVQRPKDDLAAGSRAPNVAGDPVPQDGANQPESLQPNALPPVDLPLANNATLPGGPPNANTNIVPRETAPREPTANGSAGSTDGAGSTDSAAMSPTTPGSPSPTTLGNAAGTKSPLGGSIAPSLDAVLAPPTVDAQPAGEPNKQLPPGLQGFSNLFQQSFDSALTDASAPIEKAPDLPDDADATPANQAGANPVVDPIPATVDKQLGTSLSGILINARPLSEALTTLAVVSDLPIVPDLDALALIGASKSMVKVKMTSTATFDAVLKSISSETKISWVPWENRVLYARVSDQELESRLPGSLPVADLVSDAAQRDQLLQALKEVFPELGDALQMNEGGVQLALTKENRLTWFQLARMLETWRVARGIVNATTKELVPEAGLLPAWPVEAVRQAVRRPVKQMLPAEPLARNWQRLAADAQLECWVDWHGLLMAEINPRQKGTIIGSGRTLGEILQTYANKYQLVFAIENGRALWVTSPDMHRMQPRLFVLSLAEKSQEEWTAEMESLAPLNPTNSTSMLKLIPTPDGQYLFARCCRPILAEPN